MATQKLKGQNLRIFAGNNTNTAKCLAAATNCTLSIDVQVEDSSTKDSTGDWQEQEAVGKSWSVTTEALVTTGTDDTGQQIVDMLSLIGTELYVKIGQTQVNSDKNRTAVSGGINYGGKAILTSCQINSTNRQNATYTCTFTGNGPLA